jgi:hypothetical protein
MPPKETVNGVYRAVLEKRSNGGGGDPDTDSKQALGGKNGGGVPKSDTHKSNNSQSQPTTHGEKGCNDVHFDSIRDKKGFANAADARAGIQKRKNRHPVLALDPEVDIRRLNTISHVPLNTIYKKIWIYAVVVDLYICLHSIYRHRSL